LGVLDGPATCRDDKAVGYGKPLLAKTSEMEGLETDPLPVLLADLVQPDQLDHPGHQYQSGGEKSKPWTIALCRTRFGMGGGVQGGSRRLPLRS